MYKTLVVGTDGSPTADMAVAGRGRIGPFAGRGAPHRDGLPCAAPGMGAAPGVAMVDCGRRPGAGRGERPRGGRRGHREVRGRPGGRGARGAGQPGRRHFGDRRRGGRRPDRRGEQGDARRRAISAACRTRWRTVPTARCWWSRPISRGRAPAMTAWNSSGCGRTISTGRSPRTTTTTSRPCSTRRSWRSTVDFLAELAGDGAALELGVGTGRIALPLAARGVPVHGIDLSPDMVARLREKPGADDVGVTIGDFATTVVPGAFRLAYLVFNTIGNLTTPGRSGGLLRQRRASPRTGRVLRH